MARWIRGNWQQTSFSFGLPTEVGKARAAPIYGDLRAHISRGSSGAIRCNRRVLLQAAHLHVSRCAYGGSAERQLCRASRPIGDEDSSAAWRPSLRRSRETAKRQFAAQARPGQAPVRFVPRRVTTETRLRSRSCLPSSTASAQP